MKSAAKTAAGRWIKKFLLASVVTLIILGRRETRKKETGRTVIAAKPKKTERKGKEREERERKVELCGGYAKADDGGYPRLLAELLLLNDYVT